MHDIQVSSDVFAKIWSLRKSPEATEDEILSRVLNQSSSRPLSRTSRPNAPKFDQDMQVLVPSRGKMRWVDDVRDALLVLGGKAHLSEIYTVVAKNRKNSGRSVPQSIEAIIRKELEQNSSDSLTFAGRDDLFMLPNGHGTGIWAIRENS